MESMRKLKPNPRENANIISVLLWCWIINIFKEGYKERIGTEKLYDPLKEDQSNLLGDRLEKQWNTELKKSKKRDSKPSLIRTICYTFLREYCLLGLMHLFIEFIRLSTPMFLGGLLRYFQKDSIELYETALWYAAGICVTTGISTLIMSHTITGSFHLGLKIRVAVCSLIYRKVLRLNKNALGETAPGKVVNLIANDVNKFDLAAILSQFIWSTPLTTLIIGYILYHKVGYASLIGIAVICIVTLIQSYTSKLASSFRLQTATKIDERVRLMDEIISGVQVIKMYAWEKPFCVMIELTRKLELREILKNSYIRGIYMTLMLFTNRISLYCTLISFLISGNNLSAEKVFVLSCYFNMLAYTMSGMFIRGITEIAECLVTTRRLQHFLMHEEFKGSNVICKKPFSNVNSGQAFNKDSNQDLLFIDNDVDIQVKETLNKEDNQEKQNGNIITDATDSINYIERGEQSFVYNDDSWAVKMTNVTAKWELNQSENILEDLNLEIQKGKLYAVIGMVGSGKSSLLSAILGEINLLNGQVKVNGNLSYASQEAWVFGSTIRQNILFGQSYDRQRYQRVIKTCALLKDFKQFPQGDQTIVGERGNSLSGGQKARINLARTLYRQADIYLLDDPLSAVDAHVSKHLFQECILRYLAGKTRILVTHQLQYIKEVDAIILLEQGRMKHFLHYQDLLALQPEYGVLLASEDETNIDSTIEKNILKRQFSTSSNKSCIIMESGPNDENEDKTAEQQISLEETSRGTVKGSLLIKYFQISGNIWRCIICIFLFIFTQFIVNLNDWFISILINAEEKRHYLTEFEDFNNTITDVSKNMTDISDIDILPRNIYIYIYTVIVLSIFFVSITRSLFFCKTCVMCSQRLHDMMFDAFIRTKMRFFDINPSGRILNRFSKDMNAIDEFLPKALMDANQLNMYLLGTSVIICIINPIFLVPIVLICIVCYWTRKVYAKTSKNIKRLEGMSMSTLTRSPVFTHLNVTLNGLTTIRAYCNQDILKEEFDKLQDLHSSSVYMFFTTNGAFLFFLDICCFIMTISISFSFLIMKESFSGGEVGLAITQIMALTSYFLFGVRQNAEVTNLMMAVERIIEYIQIPPEPNLKDRQIYWKKKERQNLTLLIDIPKNWPDAGCIEFKDVYMRYANEDPPVLKELNIMICAGEKVGIVGRTGAGKSSLISALFRLAEVEGIIEIDGMNTSSIALEDLRRKISIIPQDPILFSGTLRRNLDPFNEFPDKNLWEALEEVELKDAITGNGLESRIFDKGSNYSIGQKQLVCLARAILKNNRILMLDEATANVDPHTDALIQSTIRKKFVTCTILTIAHRLNTIIDNDKVLVMDKGYAIEYDHPYILLQNSNSQFTSLVKETGMYDQLFKVAKQSYTAKYEEA